ncbi:MAG: 30S ribosomal protein S6 [Planctomycetes bacterium]|nr:30S ribosomal protein S6 [Planctomycetota bacterium]
MYEGMFLLDSGRFANNPQKAVDEVLGILEKAGATVVAHRPWQEGKLAYPIEGRTKGLYYLTFFRMEANGIPEIARGCKLSDLVLRHLVLRHPRVLFDAMVSALTGEEVQPEKPEAAPEPIEEPEETLEAEIPDAIEDEVTDEEEEVV